MHALNVLFSERFSALLYLNFLKCRLRRAPLDLSAFVAVVSFYFVFVCAVAVFCVCCCCFLFFVPRLFVCAVISSIVTINSIGILSYSSVAFKEQQNVFFFFS